MANKMEKLRRIQCQLVAPKDKPNDFGGYKYRSAESILAAVKPLLETEKCALTLSDEIIVPATELGRVYVKATATLYDENTGEVIASTTAFAREAGNKKGMDDSQVTGATSSYARKYALNGLLAIDDTKDADTNEYTAQYTLHSLAELLGQNSIDAEDFAQLLWQRKFKELTPKAITWASENFNDAVDRYLQKDKERAAAKP